MESYLSRVVSNTSPIVKHRTTTLEMFNILKGGKKIMENKISLGYFGAILMIFLMMFGFVSAFPSNDATSDGSLSRDRSIGNSNPTLTSSSSKGSGFITKMTWNGERCVNRDVMSNPRIYSVYSTLSAGYMEVLGSYPLSEDKRWVVKIIPGEYGYAPDKSCDPNEINLEPLRVDWWRFG